MLLIGNGRLIAMDERNTFLEDGCVAIEGRLISEVGETASLREKYPDADFLDARGGLIMPGLINAHNHIYSAFARGMSIAGYHPADFLDILKGMWWNIDEHLTLEDVTYSAYWTYLDGIKNGVTTVFDHHASYGAVSGSLFAISEVARELGLRTCLCYEVSDRAGQEKMKEAVAENEQFIQYARTTEDQRGMMGLHASFTLSDASLDYAAAHTPAGAGYHIHVAEGMADQTDCLQKHGKRVVQRLHDFGILGPHTVTGHCIHVSPLELELLKATDTMVVHNPESNMGNAVGCPPTMEIMRRGILTGLGTDGYTNDMYESMKVANILHKHNTMDPNAAWAEVPQMLFQNNAKITNRFFDATVGQLSPGAAADVIVADYIPQTPLNQDNYSSHILFGMTGRSVVHTVASGKILMKERELLCADEGRIYARCRELAKRLAERINS